MDRKTVTLSALLALTMSGLVYTVIDGRQVQIVITERPKEAVEIKDEAAVAPLLAQITDSGARGELTCRRGVIDNAPLRIYCTDGVTAGFLLDPAAEAAVGEAATVQLLDGKPYATPADEGP